MTAKEFVQDEGARLELAKVIANPAFKRACEAVIYEEIPTVDSLSTANDTIAAAKLRHLCGMKQLLTRLASLSEVREERTKPAERRLYTDADKEMLLKREEQ
jgi:hypothetical protein